MAKTSLNINGQKVAALTIQMGNELSIDLYQTDDNYEEIGTPEKFIMQNQSEQEWHQSFRREAKSKGHYIPEFSTDPNWDIDPEPTI